MEWANISRWDGECLGGHGQKIPFHLPRPNVPIRTIKRVGCFFQRSSKIFHFPYETAVPKEISPLLKIIILKIVCIVMLSILYTSYWLLCVPAAMLLWVNAPRGHQINCS